LIYSTEKSVSEHGDKLSDDDKKAIEDAIADLKSTLENEDADPEEIKEKTATLNTAQMKIGQAIYGTGDAGAAQGDDAQGAENVQDADFEEKDDKKSSA